jgi:HEPN domain-containing protein
MNAQALARDYLRKGKARRSALQVLFEEESYDDVVREVQAIVELILKGTLRFIGVDPPKRVVSLQRAGKYKRPAQ